MTKHYPERSLRSLRLNALTDRIAASESRSAAVLGKRLLEVDEGVRLAAAEDDPLVKEVLLEELDAREGRLLDTLEQSSRERVLLEQQVRQLRAWWDDREVWIRTSRGEALRKYHVGTSCGLVSGRGRYPGLFKRLFETEARAKGLRPCSVGACYAEFRPPSGSRG